VSPTAPTIVTLNDQLRRAHRRIRELQSREIELLAQNRTLWAAITEVTDEDARSPAELCTSPLTARSSTDVRFGVGEPMRSTTKAREHNSS
jgi:predicted transcriptional regulator